MCRYVWLPSAGRRTPAPVPRLGFQDASPVSVLLLLLQGLADDHKICAMLFSLSKGHAPHQPASSQS